MKIKEAAITFNDTTKPYPRVTEPTPRRLANQLLLLWAGGFSARMIDRAILHSPKTGGYKFKRMIRKELDIDLRG